MAVLAGMIKADKATNLASAVASIFSKNKVLKDLDIDYVGSTPVSETHGVYEVELVGAIEDADDSKAVNAIKEAIVKETRNSQSKLADAFKKAYGKDVIARFGWADAEYADDPDGTDAIRFTVEFAPTSVSASRNAIRLPRR